jgi:hypothetical protein
MCHRNISYLGGIVVFRRVVSSTTPTPPIPSLRQANPLTHHRMLLLCPNLDRPPMPNENINPPFCLLGFLKQTTPLDFTRLRVDQQGASYTVLIT